MNILIHLSNSLISEAIKELLTKQWEGHRIIACCKTINGFRPEIILVDNTTLKEELFSQYPDAKVILIDTGLRKESIVSALLCYKIWGVVSTNTDFHIFQKVLDAVCKGEIWIDNNVIKELLHNREIISKRGKITGITEREKEIIECVCQGYSNKEIASRLCISEQTVKAHLNKIFRKFGVSGRFQLIKLVIENSTLGLTLMGKSK